MPAYISGGWPGEKLLLILSVSKRIMKSNKEFRAKGQSLAGDDIMKKVVKLPPIKKSDKDKHYMFSSIEEEDDDAELESYRKKESVLDYFDDGEEEI